MNSANKGEWSELYALGFLLSHGGGYAADERANIDKSLFYKVLEIVDNPTGQSEVVYKLNESDVVLMQNGVGLIRISKDQISNALKVFFDDLVSCSGARAFSLGSGENLLKLLSKSKLSASSSVIEDIQLVLEDFDTKVPTPRKGFSIKSEIGNPATVFNASRSTNITYRILGTDEFSPFADVSPVKSNLKQLLSKDIDLEFVCYDNLNLQSSLENIDSNLPIFIAELLLAYYKSNTTNLKLLCESIWPENSKASSLKISKIKKFLSAISMGLRANEIWSGYPKDFGGLLLVKENGDVLFYYLYNLEKFEEYLFSQLKFDTPSATRHGFGQIYREDSELRIKLNLQIRF